ncbi:hypothetical protein EYF80_053686 [Liparis tanakae]|uniref:Uncharacterized protein n=1 Tax=Liparis tanakae TaxID=230148 RepID=A0A4Z2F5W0_9TELE|nr:hypothetical protein EYF80_053686 [Liparis tanakae]
MGIHSPHHTSPGTVSKAGLIQEDHWGRRWSQKGSQKRLPGQEMGNKRLNMAKASCMLDDCKGYR